MTTTGRHALLRAIIDAPMLTPPHEPDAHRTLEDVIRWGLAQSPPALIVDVIVQDEFTHDVVVAHDNRWLVYDAT